MALFESHPDRVSFKEEHVASHWSGVVPEAADSAEKLMDEVRDALVKFGFPEDAANRKELITGVSLMGKTQATRPCLYMEREGFRVFFSAYVYGRHLIASQIVVDEPIVKDMPKMRGIFGKEMAGAFLFFANAARIAAVEAIAKDAGQDASKINMETKTGIVDIT